MNPDANPQPTALPAGEPWNPLTLWAVSYWITVFASGILLGLNWKRLGKPEWQTRTIIAAIVVPLIGVGYIVGMITLVLNQIDHPLGFSFIMSGVGLIFGFVAALAYLQYAPYQKWRKNHDIAGMLTHTYNFKRAVAVVIAFMIGMVAFGVFIQATS